MTTTAAAKDRITCHVLDTSIGRPAKGVRVKLEFAHHTLDHSTSTSNSTSTTTRSAVAPSKVFESQTDDDGRIKSWLPYSSATSSGEVPVYTLEDLLVNEVDVKGGASRWTLRFDTGAYYGEDHTFFPEVSVAFQVEHGQHCHVPLLLAPYSYSTYRGS